MTKSEFQKKVIELIKKYRLNKRMKERIIPLFSLVDNLSQEEMSNVYNIIKETIVTQKETEELSLRLQALFNEFNNSIKDVSKRLNEIKSKLEEVKDIDDSSYFNQLNKGRLPNRKELHRMKDGSAMKFNRNPFPGDKPNFGLKLNKLFCAFITEYGPEYITVVISDSILYNNNLILRVSLKTGDVLIGSSRSLKLYETENGENFLITDKPEVIPYGSRNEFYFKNITYEDILNLTNGDFFKVFDAEILKSYKDKQIGLTDELKKVGYYSFE